MPSKFCQRCFDRVMDRHRLQHGEDPTFFIDAAECSFSCQIPVYELDESGRPIVKIWDCSENRTLIYSQAEWERKQREGEV